MDTLDLQILFFYISDKINCTPEFSHTLCLTMLNIQLYVMFFHSEQHTDKAKEKNIYCKLFFKKELDMEQTSWSYEV